MPDAIGKVASFNIAVTAPLKNVGRSTSSSSSSHGTRSQAVRFTANHGWQDARTIQGYGGAAGQRTVGLFELIGIAGRGAEPLGKLKPDACNALRATMDSRHLQIC